jgi:hypothetical protein
VILQRLGELYDAKGKREPVPPVSQSSRRRQSFADLDSFERRFMPMWKATKPKSCFGRIDRQNNDA